MTLSELCIRRPVMTTLMMLSILVIGIVGYRSLPVAALPQVDYPTITVSAALPGASPETMAATVATPLERQFSTIAGISSMTSSSTRGSTSITLQFDLRRNIDAAALDVQAALSVAQSRLPTDMPAPPSFQKVNPANQPILFISLRSPSMPLSKVNDYGDFISRQLSQIPGVAQVSIYGPQKYAVRIALDPDAAAARNLTFSDVRTAVAAANSNLPVGTLSGREQSLSLNATGQIENAEGYRDLIVTWRKGTPIRLQDIARISDGVENDKVAAWFNDTRSITLAIQRQPDANTVTVADAVRAKIPQIQAQLPPSVTVSISNDRSISIRDSVATMEEKLIIVIALVVLVIFLFLKTIRATFIPALAVPFSLIGTCAVMALLGYSINNLSLLALTLAVGFVVDDAIVMLENIYRHIENGMKPFDAALTGSREIGFTILAMTISLVAVFIPVLFMEGVVGRLFREFAVTISVAILVSGFVSLTLTPMLCARWLKPMTPRPPLLPVRVFERGYQVSFDLYRRSLDWTLHHRGLVLGFTLLTLGVTIWMYILIPKGFFPTEDTGFIITTTETAPGTSFEATIEKQKQVMDLVAKDPAVAYFISSVGGGSGVNGGRMFLALKPLAERGPIEQVMLRLRRTTSAVPGMTSFFQPIQTLTLGGRPSRSAYQYTLTSTEPEALVTHVPRFVEKFRTLPQLADIISDLDVSNPQVQIDIDRDKAASLGISVQELRSALQLAFSSQEISTIYTPANDYAVMLDMMRTRDADLTSVSQLYLRTSSGPLVPLETVARVSRGVGPRTINHQDQLTAVTISFNLAPGVSLSQGMEAVQAAEREIGLPDALTSRYGGAAQVFQESSQSQTLLLLAAVLAMYIILGILYESYIHPLTILSGLPSAGIGALGVLMLSGFDLSLIALIGVVMLIGIVKKNAIMMVDFALAAQRSGTPAFDAMREACLKRYRPIMMTTLAALAGVLPIAFGSGAGAELRQPLGVAVVGGLLFSQLLTLYITPVVYLWMEQLRERFSQGRTDPAAA